MNWQENVASAAVLAAFLAAGCASQEPTDVPRPPHATASTAAPAAEAAPTVTSDGASSGPAKTVVEALPAAQPPPTEVAAYAAPPVAPVVCSYERRTGSNRKIKVCRRPQTALDEEDMRRTFDSLRRSQMGEPR